MPMVTGTEGTRIFRWGRADLNPEFSSCQSLYGKLGSSKEALSQKSSNNTIQEAALRDLDKNEGAQGEACDEQGCLLIPKGGIKGAMNATFCISVYICLELQRRFSNF